jgi:hypothetical protein
MDTLIRILKQELLRFPTDKKGETAAAFRQTMW